MAQLRQYAVSMVAAALICGIITGMTSGISSSKMLRMLCGILLTLVLLQPLSRLELPSLEIFLLPQINIGEEIASRGKEMSLDATSQIIKSTCEAYILDKAREEGTELSVTVTLDRDHIPVSATLSGEISHASRTRLEMLMETELGIAKEKQLWMG